MNGKHLHQGVRSTFHQCQITDSCPLNEMPMLRSRCLLESIIIYHQLSFFALIIAFTNTLCALYSLGGGCFPMDSPSIGTSSPLTQVNLTKCSRTLSYTYARAVPNLKTLVRTSSGPTIGSIYVVCAAHILGFTGGSLVGPLHLEAALLFFYFLLRSWHLASF